MKARPNSDGQTLSAFLAAAFDDLAAVGGAHFLAKTVSCLSFDVGFIRQRLFHGFLFRLGFK